MTGPSPQVARALAATGGATAGAALAAALLVAIPWRPAGLWVALVAVAGVSAAAAAGVGLVLRSRGMVAHAQAARVTALGAPAMIIFFLLLVLNIAGPGGEGRQQVIALVLGAASAGWLGARFSTED